MVISKKIKITTEYSWKSKKKKEKRKRTEFEKKEKYDCFDFEIIIYFPRLYHDYIE